MRLERLSELCCIHKECRGELRIGTVISGDNEKLVEGFLLCESCGARYPVIAGIPILVRNPGKGLRHQHYFMFGLLRGLKALSPAMEQKLNQLMLESVEKRDEKMFPEQPHYTRANVSTWLFTLGGYFLNHYGSLTAMAAPGDPLLEFVARHADERPLKVLERWIDPAAKPNTIAVDLGCGIGGFTGTLASRGYSSWGIDAAFCDLLIASIVLQGFPRTIKSIPIFTDGRKTMRLALPDPVRDKRIQFAVAEIERLPFRDNSVPVVASCNLIDIVHNPFEFLNEKLRILERGGKFLLSDPFEFIGSGLSKIAGLPRKEPIELVRDALRDKISIEHEKDLVPWISPRYRRNYVIYYNWCMSGQKL